MMARNKLFAMVVKNQSQAPPIAAIIVITFYVENYHKVSNTQCTRNTLSPSFHILIIRARVADVMFAEIVVGSGSPTIARNVNSMPMCHVHRWRSAVQMNTNFMTTPLPSCKGLPLSFVMLAVLKVKTCHIDVLVPRANSGFTILVLHHEKLSNAVIINTL